MRRAHLFFVLLLALAAKAAALEPARRLETFDRIWTQIRDRYYDPSFNDIDWNAVRARYRPRVSEAGSDEAFLQLLRAMTGELRDAHTRVLSPAQARARAGNRASTAGVILFEVGGQPVVFDLRPDGPAAAAGLTAGMRVLSVNGVPIEEALARARAEVGPSSSPRAALVLSYLRLIEGPPEEMLRLQVAREDGSLLDVALPRRDFDRRPRFEARRLASGALYVRFDRFRAPVARRFLDALRANPDPRGLILDLRSNAGGDGEEGAALIGPLLDRPTVLARLATRSGRPPSALLGLVRLPMVLRSGEAGRQLYAGPLIILVNEGTGSTAEVVTASLQEQGRARVIGSPSCGCALGVLRYRSLPNGGALAISEVGLVSGLGRRIEGEGVRPDLPVALQRSDLVQGRDPALDRAEQELERMRR